MHFYSLLPSPREALTIRPANLAEFRFCKPFGQKQAGNSHANVDAIGAHGTRRGRGGLFRNRDGQKPGRRGKSSRCRGFPFAANSGQSRGINAHGGCSAHKHWSGDRSGSCDVWKAQTCGDHGSDRSITVMTTLGRSQTRSRTGSTTSLGMCRLRKNFSPPMCRCM
jgi:hypothetical protein